MIRLEDDCVECSKPCTSACPMYDLKEHYYCDVCGEEYYPQDLFDVDGVMVCYDCLPEYLVKKGIIGRVSYDE